MFVVNDCNVADCHPERPPNGVECKINTPLATCTIPRSVLMKSALISSWRTPSVFFVCESFFPHPKFLSVGCCQRMRFLLEDKRANFFLFHTYTFSHSHALKCLYLYILYIYMYI